MQDFKKFKKQPLMSRVGFAFEGIADSARTSSSFRTQLIVGGLGVIVFAILKAGALWWVLLILSSSSVLALELVNTSLEHLLDALNPSVHPLIKRSKDCAAGAVLVSSLGAIGIFLTFVMTHLRS